MYKLKTTVQTLEASLSKKNKEIAELKKSRNEDDNSSQNLGEFLFLHDLPRGSSVNNYIRRQNVDLFWPPTYPL